MKLNLPTKVTLARMALIPLILVFYYLIQVSPIFILIMTITFIIASATDAIDGHLARSRNMVTTMGKFLDPIADKSLVVAGLFIIVDSGVLSIWSLGMIGSIIIMIRELSISAFRQIAATKGVVMAADKLGKLKTIFTLIAIPALFLGLYRFYAPGKAIETIGGIFWLFGVIMFVLSVVLTIWSGINYVVKNKQVFNDDKVEAETAPVEANEDTDEVVADAEESSDAEIDK